MTEIRNSKQYDLEERSYKFMRIKIARKEAKESHYWLNLVDMNGDAGLEKECSGLANECRELMLILGAILRKSELN